MLEKGLSTDVAFFYGRFYSILACFMGGKGLIYRCGLFPWQVLQYFGMFYGRKKVQTDDFDIIVFP